MGPFFVVDTDQSDVGVVITVFNGDACHLDLLDELTLIGVH
jgi:hypothetical protein